MSAGLAAVAAGPAGALPGDPPIELRSPAAGATLRGGGDLVFTCPAYRSADFGGGSTITNGPDAYTVLVADSGRLDAEGRLADVVARGTGDSAGGVCRAPLGNGLPTGRLWWQVSRLCSQCSPPFEVSEVRPFTLAPATRPRLRVPARVYAGYPFIAVLPASGLATGTTVTVQRRVGGRWRRAGAATVTAGRADATVVLPRGRQRLRARGGIVTSRAVSVRVRPARGAAVTAVRPGRWTGRPSTAFRVRGRRVQAFTTRVPLLCPAPGMVDPFTTQLATARVRSARLAPDGAFVGTSAAGGAAVRIRGRLRGGRLSGGRVEMSLGGCSGSATLRATPSGRIRVVVTPEDVVRRYIDATSAADGDTAASLTAEDAVIELPGGGVLKGKDGARRFAAKHAETDGRKQGVQLRSLQLSTDDRFVATLLMTNRELATDEVLYSMEVGGVIEVRDGLISRNQVFPSPEEAAAAAKQTEL